MPRRSQLSALRRSGCTTCKNRHKKCDEQKPRCGHCIRLGLECRPAELFRPLQLSRRNIGTPLYFNRSPDAASAEVSAPEIQDFWEADDEGVVCTTPKSTTSDSTISDSTTSESTTSDNTTSNSTASLTYVGFSPWPYPITCVQPQASSRERHLLHHYTFKLSTVLVNVDGPSNPLRSVILPRAVTWPTLMNAVYATTALHVFVGNHDEEFRITSLAYYNKAVSALHSLIQNLNPRKRRADLEVILLTAVFLCKYEIISGAFSNWRSHLQGIRQMFDMFQEHTSTLPPETVAYVQSFIAYHSRIASLTSFETISSPTTIYIEQDFEIAMTSLNTIDPYMGLSARCISLLHVAAETIMVDATDPSNPGLMMKTVIKIYHRLPPDVEELATFDPFNESTPEPMDYLGHIASAYKSALVAYLHIILDAIEANTATDELMLQCLGMRSLLVSTKDEAISACLQDMVCVPDDKSCAVGLVPLLFIVASETGSRTEFETASQRLQAILKTASLGNIAPALELLQMTQQDDGGDWRQILKDFGCDLIVT